MCWLLYGNAPTFNKENRITWDMETKLVGGLSDNPFTESIEDNTIIKISIRKLKEIK